MTALARADLESLLRDRRLDRTLTSALPQPGGDETAATGINVLDAQLGGGFPRGHLSEIVGPSSSGRTTIVNAALAAAVQRGELVALIDALDMFDVAGAAPAFDLDRFLWIRGLVVTSPGMCRDLNQRALEQSLKALTLVLQAGNFGVVVLDVAGAPADALRRLPFTTWLRLQRMIEGTPTTCLLSGDRPMARSNAGLTLVVSRGSGVESQESRVESRVESSVESRVESRVKPSVESLVESVVRSSVESPVESSVKSQANRRSRLFRGIDINARVVQARCSRNAESRVPGRESRDVRLHLQAAV